MTDPATALFSVSLLLHFNRAVMAKALSFPFFFFSYFSEYLQNGTQNTQNEFIVLATRISLAM